MLRAIYLHGVSSAPDSTNLFQSIHFFISLTEDNKYIITNLLLNRDMNLSVMNGKFSIWTKQMLRSLPRWYSQWIYILVLTKKQIDLIFQKFKAMCHWKPTSNRPVNDGFQTIPKGVVLSEDRPAKWIQCIRTRYHIKTLCLSFNDYKREMTFYFAWI